MNIVQYSTSVNSPSDQTNNSFHRMCNSDIEEESDCDESIFSSSIQSIRSRKTQISRNGSFAQRSFNNSLSPSANRLNQTGGLNQPHQLNHSMNSTKSISPSVFTASVLRDPFTNSSMSMLNQSMSEATRPVFNKQAFGSRESIWDGRHSQASFAPTSNRQMNCGECGHASESVLNGSHASIRQPQYCQDSFLASKFGSMNSLRSYEPTPDEFHSELNGLNIADRQFNYNPHLNPTPFSETSSVLRHRKQLISPSRLHCSTAQSPQSVTQSSWVAGGYWNSPSPQKKFPQPPTIAHEPVMYPILSRTSSQSSGFESHTSSVHNNGAEHFSRESSVCGDIDRASVFSEQSFMPDSVSQVCTQYAQRQLNSTFTMGDVRVQPVFPTLNDSQHTFIRPSSVMNSSSFRPDQRNHPLAQSQPTLYHQFGTQRVAPKCASSSNSLFNFNKLTNNLPPIQRGSLLKSWKETSMTDLTQNM